MSSDLVLQSGHNDNWEFVFRKQEGRPIEILKRHKLHGHLGGWQVARNMCLKGLIEYDVLAKHFGMSEWEFHYQQVNMIGGD